MDQDSDDSISEVCSTYYSATLQAPKIAEQYCPNCSEKAESRLCSKCRDRYVCEFCSLDGVCSDCFIMCAICYIQTIRADFLPNVCQACEDQISELSGDVIDEYGNQYKNLIEIINLELTGQITLDEEISDEMREYLHSQNIDAVYFENG